MARIVGVYAVPHTPSFVDDVKLNGELSETAEFFSIVRSHFEHAEPDVIVTINNDHFNTFFLDNWPTYAIGVADITAGPNDQTPGMPWRELAIETEAARHILRSVIEDGFDFASSQEFDIDHGALVPLHFLAPAMALPIVPIFVNCVVPPLPRSRRCYQLGRSIAAAIHAWESDTRVAVITSGSLSLEIGGPRVGVDKTFGVPDPAWAAWILERVRLCEHDTLIDVATEARMLKAGNVSGELLNWIIALGMAGQHRPEILINQPALGNAFAARDAERSPDEYLFVHKLCRRVLHDKEFRQLILENPEKAVSSMPFSEAEQAALLAGDVARLYQEGVSAFLLLILGRFEVFDLRPSIFNCRMRTVIAEQVQ